MRQLLRFNTFTTIFTANWYFQQNASKKRRTVDTQTRICYWANCLFHFQPGQPKPSRPHQSAHQASQAQSIPSRSSLAFPISQRAPVMVSKVARTRKSQVQLLKTRRSQRQQLRRAWSTWSRARAAIQVAARFTVTMTMTISCRIKSKPRAANVSLIFVYLNTTTKAKYDLWPWPRARRSHQTEKWPLLVSFIAMFLHCTWIDVNSSIDHTIVRTTTR